MIFSRNGNYYNRHFDPTFSPRSRFKTLNFAGFCMLSVLLLLISLSLWSIILRTFIRPKDTNLVIVSPNSIEYTTGKYFVSYALDTATIIGGISFDISNPKFNNLVSLLGPAYLRIGGNAADQLIFDEDSNINDNNSMNAQQWLQLHNFFQRNNMELIFDLNVLIRNSDGSWNSTNAEQLINFSARNNLSLHWELGNEPNFFQHKFNQSVNATQLAKDFKKLRAILDTYDLYRYSMLLGPDTTRPVQVNNISVEYFKEFLQNRPPVDVLTWHQYYLNGHNTSAHEFHNLKTFELLETQIRIIKQLVDESDFKNFPIWLGETSSAYGGGAPNLSDSYIASFLWLDKLGLSAQYGLETVIRQSIYGNYYALIDNQYEPTPDWWVTMLYRSYVGRDVIKCFRGTEKKVRLYCHCTSPEALFDRLPGVTIFGINLNSYPIQVKIRFSDRRNRRRSNQILLFEYTVTGTRGLLSREIALNNIPLKLNNGRLPPFRPHTTKLKDYHTMPPFSIVFWVVHGIDATICPNH